ncbi:YqhA family protein [Methanosarcina sp.]|uniref:YqhA family protein n=1 Tax=Methanosarcina sp. TaxID=2213 RepID=UPI002ABB3AAA|nr:YqhA family protein [Methanosarcina sp.]MDY9925337.1 YqhA family protein [Methanosarcina sp.]
MKVVKFIAGMRFFVLIPVIGLTIAACTLFIKGGIDIVHFIGELITGMAETSPEGKNVIVEIVETVHLFLVGTVLFLTSFGLYQLFIQPLPLPGWLKVNDIEELELNLVGLTIVVLGVNFLSVIFEPEEVNLAIYGIGYALPIAALAYFMGVRSHIAKRSNKDEEEECLKAIGEIVSPDSEPDWSLKEKKD